jgi:outer membrane protein assembly factor BamB
MKIKLPHFLLAGLLTLSSLSQAQLTTQWRANDRKGIYEETNLLKTWPTGGPQLLWSINDIGNGYGSPTISGDKLFITGEEDSTAYLMAFDLKGKQLWRTAYGSEWVKTFPGSRCAPTVDGNLVYVTTGNSKIACFNGSTGQGLWYVDGMKELHGQPLMHGFSEAPLIDGNKVFLVPGGKDTNVVALDKITGKIVWICKGNGERPAYNSPLLIRLPERNILVTFTAYSFMGIDTKTGELLWTHEQDNVPADKKGQFGWGDTHSNTAWFENGSIYYFAGDGNGAVKLELSADGKRIKQLWRVQDIDNYMGGFIIDQNTIYTCVSEKKGLRTLDASTGAVIDSLKCGTGTIIMADDMLYYYNQKGEVLLIKPQPRQPMIAGTFKITAGTKEHFAHPVIHNGVLYIRHGKSLQAFDIKSR